MGKAVKKIVNIGTAGISGELDLWGDKAADAQKKAADQAARDAAALQESSTTSPTLGGDDVAAAREAERQRKLALAGQNSTILTGASGLTGATSGGKSLLGS